MTPLPPLQEIFSRNIVGGSVARGAVHGHSTDFDPGALLERGASRQTEQPSAAVRVDQVFCAPLLSSRHHVFHHVR